jgi:GDP-L-fucose synthase
LCELMDYHGTIVWEVEQPNGQPRRCLDVRRAEAEFNFRAQVGFREGLLETIEWYRAHAANPLPALAV